MSTKLIYGKYLVADAETVIPSGALFVEDDKIVVTNIDLPHGGFEQR